jgi:hypothetical protein
MFIRPLTARIFGKIAKMLAKCRALNFYAVVYIITTVLETCSQYLKGLYSMDMCANFEDAPETTFIVQSQVTKGRYFWYIKHPK